MISRLIRRSGRVLRQLGNRLSGYGMLKGTWIDVGSHLGEKTFSFAEDNPALLVYAFEPNLEIAVHRMGCLRNFVVLPMAVAEYDGDSDFYVNDESAASSLLPFDENGLGSWIGGRELTNRRKTRVPTMRLDTFMNRMKIRVVDYLKIDAQGTDFAVIKSAGKRLKDIRRICLEVQITPIPLYSGATRKEEVVEYLNQGGFALVDVQRQTENQEENLTFLRVP